MIIKSIETPEEAAHNISRIPFGLKNIRKQSTWIALSLDTSPRISSRAHGTDRDRKGRLQYQYQICPIFSKCSHLLLALSLIADLVFGVSILAEETTDPISTWIMNVSHIHHNQSNPNFGPRNVVTAELYGDLLKTGRGEQVPEPPFKRADGDAIIITFSPIVEEPDLAKVPGRLILVEEEFVTDHRSSRSNNNSNSNTSGDYNQTSTFVTEAENNESTEPSRLNISLLQGFLASIFCMLIVLTVIGNTLVILSVLTTRRLRTVTNCFVMSLAVADWLVGLFVMPPAVAVFLLDTWQLGRVLCDIWISLDVLLCTASILSLCAISIDRYLAVTQPLNYSRRRRSKRLALLMILVVWVLAIAITCPPMLGWYDSAERGSPEDCHYNQNKAYVVYSAMGSFFIPMFVMIYVYVQISCVIAKRHDHMSEIEVHKKGHRSKEVTEMEIDAENVSEPEPSSPRRTTCTGPAIQEIDLTRTINTSGCSSTNFSKKYKSGQYELVDSVSLAPSLPQAQQQVQRQSTYTSTFRNNTENWCNNGPVNKTNNIRVHQKSMSNRILSLKRENKTTQTLAIVVGGFIACWLPFFIAYLITPFLEKDTISDGISAFLTWLGWFNSAMNPFIYALYSVDFRAAFWRLTFRRFCKKKGPYASNNYSIRRN